MAEALEQAWQAFLQEEVPVGAVVVYDGAVISRGYNQMEQRQRAASHAEMNALEGASEVLGNWRLTGATLYSTLEPCSMCAGTALLSRIDKIVWGAPDLRHGANGSWIDLLGKPHPIHTLALETGVYASYSSELLRLFFQRRRIKNMGPI